MITVRDIMTQPVVIRSSATIETAIVLMQAHQVRSLIVEKCHEDGCYGILVERDIVHKVVALGIDPCHIRVGSLMWQACTRLPIDATLQEAAQVLADAGASHAPVVENHRLLGVVSVTDILNQMCPASDLSDEAKPLWQLPQRDYGHQERESQIVQSDNDALLVFEDDMRSGCRTTF